MSRKPISPDAPPPQNLIGMKFGRWSVVGISQRKPFVKWSCLCECGEKRDIPTANLKSGKSSSCGCLQSETVTKHGMSGTRIYSIWCRMLNFYCPKSGARKHASVCERWREFRNFHADVGDPPPGKVIGKLDNNKDYGPDNFQWVTRQQRSSNTRKNRIIEISGERMTVSEAARRFSVDLSTLRRRIVKYGMSPEEAVSAGRSKTARKRVSA